MVADLPSGWLSWPALRLRLLGRTRCGGQSELPVVIELFDLIGRCDFDLIELSDLDGLVLSVRRQAVPTSLSMF